jgi:hypothetical protein
MAMETPLVPYHSRPAREDAFWRTILTDRQIEGFHFKENAGWNPVRRLPSSAKYIPRKALKRSEKCCELWEIEDSACMDGDSA